MNVVLVNPPSSRVLYPQMGLAMLSSVLKREGFAVSIIDLVRQEDFENHFSREVERSEPSVVGFYSVTRSFPVVKQLMNRAREVCPETTIVLGGPHGTFADILRVCEEVDYVVRGEGELPMLELARSFPHLSERVRDIPSLGYRWNGTTVFNDLAPPVDVNALPLPDWDAFPLEKYWHLHTQVGRDPCISYESSRGCPYQCIFCLCHRLQEYRAKSPDTVIRELNALSEKYGPNFGIIDPCFTANKEIKVVLKKMISECDLGWWDCQTHPACVDEEMLSLMKEAGCIAVLYGVETGSQRILNILKKGCTVKQNEAAITFTKKAGIQVDATIIFGVPGETADDIEKTVHLLERTDPNFIYVNYMTPFPGSHVADHGEEYGINVAGSLSDFGLDSFVIALPEGHVQLIMEAVGHLIEIFGEERVNIG